MTRTTLFSSLALGLALAIALPAATSFAQEMSPEDIAAKLMIKPKKTRSLSVKEKKIDAAAKRTLDDIFDRKIAVVPKGKVEQAEKVEDPAYEEPPKVEKVEKTPEVYGGGQAANKIPYEEKVVEVKKVQEIKKTYDLPSLDFSISFGYDSADISPDSYATLDALATAMKSDQLYSLRFLVNGHTDAKGAETYNLALSERRANSVVAYLVKQHGIEASRLKAIGFGELELKEQSEGASAINRRVEIVSVPAS